MPRSRDTGKETDMKAAAALLGLALLAGCAGRSSDDGTLAAMGGARGWVRPQPAYNPNEAALLGAIIANRPRPYYLPMPTPPMQQQTMRLQTTCSTIGQQTYCQ